jgi:hypothetical protein
MEYIIASVALWIISIVGYVIYNLYNKNVKLENMLIKQAEFTLEMKANLKRFSELVNKIDSKIWIQSDPEFIELFENIKEMQQLAQQYED